MPKGRNFHRGARIVMVDYGPFLEANRMMFFGQLVSERNVSFGEFLNANQNFGDPILCVLARLYGAGRFARHNVFCSAPAHAKYALCRLAIAGIVCKFSGVRKAVRRGRGWV
jgi:hypothetical protein